MEKDFTPYLETLELEKIGFDEECIMYWNSYSKEVQHLLNHIDDWASYYIPAPLYSQTFRFFREKYNTIHSVYSNASGWLFEICDNVGGTHRYDSGFTGDCEESGAFTSYERAELACLRKLIEIAEKDKNR